MELKEARAALMLLAHGAKVDVRDQHGHTPASVARMAGANRARPSLIDFLELEGGSAACQRAAQEILECQDEDGSADGMAASSDEPRPPKSKQESEGEEESLTAILSSQTKAGAKTPGHMTQSFSDRVRASTSSAPDMKMAEDRPMQPEPLRCPAPMKFVPVAENARLAEENLRLQKELDESRGNLRHVQGLLDQSRSTLERMKSARLSVSEAPAEAFQAVRDDMEKDLSTREAHRIRGAQDPDPRQEMEELRQRQDVLGQERHEWLEEMGAAALAALGDGTKAGPDRGQQQALDQRERSADQGALRYRGVNSRSTAFGQEVTRPSSAVQRQVAELTRKSDELSQTTAALDAKDQALSEKDAELKVKAQAEQEALEALEAKDAELERLQSELQIAQAHDRPSLFVSFSSSQEKAAALAEREANLEGSKRELQRLKEELQRKVIEAEEARKSLGELRAQHKD
eukprot:g17051.t3